MEKASRGSQFLRDKLKAWQSQKREMNFGMTLKPGGWHSYQELKKSLLMFPWPFVITELETCV